MARTTHNFVVVVLLPIVLFCALVLAQLVWPVGGGSSMLMRLLMASIVLVTAELVVLSPVMRRGSASRPWIALFVALVSVGPIHLLVPSLPD